MRSEKLFKNRRIFGSFKHTTLFLAVLLYTLGNGALYAVTPLPEPDNTLRNTRDAQGRTLTPEDQSETKKDLELTRNLRKALVKDSSLSTTAKNIKIITINGSMTLRGPVHSQEEKDKIERKAREIAGPNKVDNQLEIVTH